MRPGTRARAPVQLRHRFLSGMAPRYSAALAAGLIAAAAAVFALWRYLRKRPSPEELERLRRLEVNAVGKVGAGEVFDVDASVLLYSYVVAGVEYEASQDVSLLTELLPPNHMHMVGDVAVKFDPRNPANSIVICEQWSGLARVRVG